MKIWNNLYDKFSLSSLQVTSPLAVVHLVAVAAVVAAEAEEEEEEEALQWVVLEVYLLVACLSWSPLVNEVKSDKLSALVCFNSWL